MKLFSAETYSQRRNALKKTVGSGILLFMGNNEAPMNYHDNTYRYRQDSNFLYFFGLNMAGLNAIIDIDNDQETIFGNELSLEDIIWMGPQPTLVELARKVGVRHVETPQNIEKRLKNTKTDIHFLPPYRYDNQLQLAEWLQLPAKEIAKHSSVPFIEAVVQLRAIKSAEEIREMTEAVNTSREMHVAVMKATAAGKTEYQLVAELYAEAKRHHAELAYPAILTINGQTLHNHYHGNTLRSGQLLLNDSGAENEMCYAGDITRTFPVDKKFTEQQREIYEIVLEMEVSSIKAMREGVQYRSIHIDANRLMLNKLKEIGLLNGDTETMLHEGVGGLFMPHGLGHAIGLDVHDMEDLGEKYVGYRTGIERSTQLGLKSLRFAKELTAGNVLTVEPGIYFIPELIDKYRAENKFLDFVNYDRLESYKTFGGVRIEDNVLVTIDGSEILGKPIPKTIPEIEELRNL
jgi:Xaa-Pro aminopeptidase